MARNVRQVIDYTDDMTGKGLEEQFVDERFSFSIDGAHFSLDTHCETANKIRELLALAAAHAEIDYYRTKPQAPTVKPKRKSNPERDRLLKKIRHWANENNFDCKETGKIPDRIIEAYKSSNPGVDMSVYTMTA
ncbi:Lsr2 family DNA-binding protein [Streptomyces melanogenes]|uniref:Lsr2 family DNA-binding protein n=1 Tax=Streptomyces melanogenes TaxID=67326 RepID=UPI00167E59C4|nr:histone-like nucleoid-structuring protein Lsr2 [Streptomyces melanogenes]GGP71990.1 hypothetical protein GCM10010278_57510 [Streptomyces melanogenes]